MPGNYIPLYGAPAQATQNKLFSAARRSIHDIAAAVGRLEHRPPGRGFPPLRWLSTLLYKLGMPSMPKADRKFQADARCNSCGICVRVCPVANIRLEGEPARPVWQHDCEQCLACLQWCPVEAIQMGKKTEKRRRYRHPAVHSKDLFLR
jgi:ferredoxin